jgi:hypothetical protein
MNLVRKSASAQGKCRAPTRKTGKFDLADAPRYSSHATISLLSLLDQLEADAVANVTDAELKLERQWTHQATVSFGRTATMADLCRAYFQPLAEFLASACDANQ